MSDLPPANWYPDPEHAGQLRYWDGTQWTEHRAPASGGVAPGSSAPDTSGTPATPTSPEQPGSPDATEPTAPGASAPGEPSWTQPAQQPGPGPGGPVSSQPPPQQPGPAPAPGQPAWGQPPGAQPYQQAASAKTNGMAIAALVLSIVWLGGLGAIAAVILGIVAIRQINAANGTEGGKGLAIAGTVIGGLGIVGAILFWSLIAFAGSVGDEVGTFFECMEQAETAEERADC